MQSQSHEFSYFLNYEKDLESLAEDYFSTRPAVVEDDQLYDYGSDGIDETDQEIDSDVDFNFSECDLSEGSKVHAFAAKPKRVDVLMKIMQIHAALPLK